MNLLDKLPTLPDEGLKNLRVNAERLEKHGSVAQRASASAILPAIDAELAARREAKRPPPKPPKTPAARGRSKKARTEPVPVDDAA